MIKTSMHPLHSTNRVEAFARIGRIISGADFAEAVTDPSALADLQNALESDSGRLDRVYDVTLDGDTFLGKAEQKISLAKSRIFDFRISPTQIWFKPVNSADLAEYADTDEGWADVIDFAAKATVSGRAGKKLNCKSGNYQCGGSCINGERACRKDINAKQKASVDSAIEKVGGKKGKTPAKSEAVATAKTKGTPAQQKPESPKPEKVDSYQKFEVAALQTMDQLNKDFNMGGLVPIYRIRREMGDRISREDFDKFIFELQSKDQVELLEEGVEDNASDKLADSVKTKFGKTRAYAKFTASGKKFADKLERADDIIEPKSGKKIKDYDSFAQEVEAAYDKYNKEFKAGDLVPIYQLRRAIGDRVSRQEFTDWLFKMQGNDVFELLEESVEDSAPDKIEDSVTTQFGKLRCYVKKIK